MSYWERLDDNIIVKTFGNWVITTYGVETTDGAISIESERLWDPDWERWIAGKNPSIEPENFLNALAAAREFFAQVYP